MASRLPAVWEISELVERFNALHVRVRGRDRWTRWRLYGLLKAYQIPFAQKRKGEGSRGTKIYVSHRALVNALGGDLFHSLLDVEALAGGLTG